MGRTSIILGGVALVLLAFIVFFERGSVSTRERQERKGQVLDTFVRDRVTRIEIQRKGVTTVLVREPAKTDDEILGGAGFRVEKPYSAGADRDAVESLIGALEFILPKRSLGELTAKDAAQFGLDKPRYRVAFQAGRDGGSFSIGAESSDGSGTYLQAGKLAYVVGKDLVEALDHEPVDYHTKRLHDGVSPYSVETLRLRDAQGEHVIEKRSDLFWLQGPEPALASQPALVEIVEGLDALEASRFAAEKPANLESYGLGTPRFFIAVDAKKFDASSNTKGEGKPDHVELRVGAPCANHAGESYVRAGDGPVMCATDADIAKLQKPLAELRESRLGVLEDGQIRSVEVRAGKRTLRVEEEGDGHHYRLLEDGKERESGAVDQTALVDWFKSLRGAKAEAFENDPSQVIGAPVATLVFERGKDKAAYEVRVGRSRGERVAVSRAGEKSIAWFSKGILPLVSTSAVRFRKTKLLDLDPSTFKKLKLSGASRTAEVVVQRGEHIQLEQPPEAVGVAVERPAVVDLARLVAKLAAVRFVAETPTPEHGLTPPQYTVLVDFGGKQPQSHTVKLGAETDGGRYAQLDSDPAVFVVGSALGRALESPVVSRSALAVPLEELGNVELVSAAGKEVVERQSPRGKELARLLATLRATKVVRYGKPEPDEGMDKPQLKIEVQPGAAGGKPRTLLFGKPVSAEPDADVYARRTDVDAAFTVARSALDEFTEPKQAGADAHAEPGP